MAEDDLVQYKDISDLKKELDVMKGRKEIPAKDLYEAVQKLTQTVTSMLDIFGAATEQMKLEEKEYGSEARKHEMIISKLDKLIEQNRTIAEGMVAIVEMVKEKIVAPAREELLFKPRPEPKPFMKPEWQPRQEQTQRQLMMASPMAQSMPPPDFGMQLPPMQPTPSPDLDFPEGLGFEEEPKKKGLFSMFKK